ncbi:OmpA family protein [Pseudoruegeria sp. HB172150]|uniref:OmpA family protein n=1 Tax=Pseudoruegeria sp. HB172150 TaxID=2721164 RepID=UPI001C131F30|nr:OmpA family protein [Pseudoruegeria sp. HB172150]
MTTLSLFSTPAAAQDDAEGSADHPEIGRYEGSNIVFYEALEYDDQRMFTSVDPEEYEDFEGAVTRIVYDLPEGASILQVMRSYEEKLAEKGFDVLVACRSRDCGRSNLIELRETTWRKILQNEFGILTVAKTSDEATTNAQIIIAPRWVNVNAVDTAAFENKVLDAEAVTSQLEAEGKIAFYDIHFDTGSAAIKPESTPTIALIAEVLTASPDLSIIVVGHTDNVGGLEDNLALSRNRAQSVVDGLIADHGIASERVTGAGVGYLAPETTNATAEGRARNRRVEIVVR